MQALRLETTPTENGRLTLENLPVKAGEPLEVIILLPEAHRPTQHSYPLRGTLLHYDNPFEAAVPTEDWEATR